MGKKTTVKIKYVIFWRYCKNIISVLSFLRSGPGVDFIKFGCTVQIIEIALLKLGARRRARSTPLKSFSKVGRRAQNSL